MSVTRVAPALRSWDAFARLARWFAARDYERDPGYRQVVLRLCGRGLFYGGVFAIVLVVAHLAAHSLLLGFDVAWSYDPTQRPRTHVVVWDKLLIFVLGALAVGVARWRPALPWARLMAVLLILVVCLAMLADDVLNGDTTFSAAYFTLVLLVAINTMPFKPWQTAGMGAAAAGLLWGGKTALPGILGVEAVEVVQSQIVYMALVVIVLTAITSLLYRHRYQQYSAQESDKRLNRMLEERSQALELLNHMLEERTHALEHEKAITEEQAARLVTMEELKARFFSNITHQFRTPLTLILGPTQDALEQRFGPVSPDLRGQMEVVHRNALSLQHLIDQLLDLSRIDAGGMRLETEKCELDEFLRDLHAAFLPLAERKSIALEYLYEGRRVTTLLDPDKLEKALSNLLSNAIKFTPPGGRVRLSALVEDAIQIEVRDTGPGIPTDELPHIFDRFHQARGIAGDGAGSGIGLALARELIELHGGTLAAESSVGFGTRLLVTLPLEMTEAAKEVESVLESRSPDDDAGEEEPDLDDVHAPATCSPASTSILLIEDHDDVRAYLRRHLEPRYHVLEAAGGREGLRLARSHRPALIICDVMMPDLDGLEVCRILKASPLTRDIPVVLLTARASEEAKIEGLAARADDYMFKPFSAAELLSRVENLIELRRLLRQTADAGGLLSPLVPEVASADKRFLDAVQASIENHLANSSFGVDWLADEVAISARQLQRRLHATVGLSAAGLIRMMRLQRAAHLLEHRTGNVSEVGQMVGFPNAVYFARVFKQAFGVTPSMYAGRHQTTDSPRWALGEPAEE
jgi:signal transduction histidine kinase/DNA-binding response OmpR family regulator